MNRGQVKWLIAFSVVATCIECVGAIGYYQWVAFVDEVATDANAGARRMAESVGFSLPSTVWWSRQLVASDLEPAEPELIVQALERLGREQQRWFTADAAGSTNLARAKLLEGEIIPALAHLRAALRRSPTKPYLHRLLALVLRQVGGSHELLDHLARAEGLAPGYRYPPIDLLDEDQNWVRRRGLEYRLEYYPRQRTTGLIALARTQRKDGDADLAFATLSEVAINPDVQLLLCDWNIEDQRYGEAAAQARAVAERRTYPASIRVKAWSRLAIALDHSGNSKGAKIAAEAALALEPGSAAPYFALASIAERRDDLEGAFAHRRTARGIDPRNLGNLSRLARLAEQLGRIDDARSALKRATEIDPASATHARRLIDFHFRQGDFMAAAMDLSTFLDRFPMDSHLLAQAERLRREVAGQ